MKWVEVDQGDDPRLLPYHRLSDPNFRREYESRNGTLIAEGLLVLEILVGARRPICSVLCSVQAAPRVAEALAGLERDFTVMVAEEKILQEVVGFPFHRGVVALAERWAQPSLEELAAASLCGQKAVLLVLEALVDHVNVGAAFRNAAALGASGVLLDPRCADPLYRRSLRVSMGRALTVPFRRAQSWPGELEQLAENGFAVVAMTTDASATPLSELSIESDRLAIAIGSEGGGLSGAVSDLAGRTGHMARIPMHGGVDSLNAATAAAIALHTLIPGPR